MTDDPTAGSGTDRDALLALLARFNLKPETVDDGLDGTVVTLKAKHGNVHGYVGFRADFAFDSDGAFKEAAVWE